MLGKLLKYEFKAVGRILLPLFCATILFSIISTLIPSATGHPDAAAIIILSRSIALIVFVIFFSASVGLGFFMSALRFKTGILGTEGYLMNTLPVSPMKNIIAKLIVSTVFQCLGIVVGCVCLFINSFKSIGSMLEWLSSMFTNISSMTATERMDALMAYSLLLLIIILFNAAIYASLSIGHSFNKGKLAVSIGAFLLLFIVGIMVADLIISAVPIVGSYFFSFLEYHGIVIAYIALALLITNYFMKNRLNLE